VNWLPVPEVTTNAGKPPHDGKRYLLWTSDVAWAERNGWPNPTIGRWNKGVEFASDQTYCEHYDGDHMEFSVIVTPTHYAEITTP
jgi:hypothetical protein